VAQGGHQALAAVVEQDPAHALLEHPPGHAVGGVFLDGAVAGGVREGHHQRAQALAGVVQGEAHQVLRLFGRSLAGVEDLDGHAVLAGGGGGLFRQEAMVVLALVEDEDPDPARLLAHAHTLPQRRDRRGSH
jgi:hypothetical protein